MSPGENLLGRLEGLREVGPGRFVARCPSHPDHTPSLSIRILDDDRVLLHDFGGCEIQDVVAAVGLSIADLFPERPVTDTYLPRRPHHLTASEALLLIGHEASAAAMLSDSLATMLAAGEQPNRLALDRLLLAAARIGHVRGHTRLSTPPEIVALRRGQR
jgi:hypothetical protein